MQDNPYFVASQWEKYPSFAVEYLRDLQKRLEPHCLELEVPFLPEEAAEQARLARQIYGIAAGQDIRFAALKHEIEDYFDAVLGTDRGKLAKCLAKIAYVANKLQERHEAEQRQSHCPKDEPDADRTDGSHIDFLARQREKQFVDFPVEIDNELNRIEAELKTAYDLALHQRPEDADQTKTVFELVRSMTLSVGLLYGVAFRKCEDSFVINDLQERYKALCVLYNEFEELPDVEKARLSANGNTSWFGVQGAIPRIIADVVHRHAMLLKENSLCNTVWGTVHYKFFDGEHVGKCRKAIMKAAEDWLDFKTETPPGDNGISKSPPDWILKGHIEDWQEQLKKYETESPDADMIKKSVWLYWEAKYAIDSKSSPGFYRRAAGKTYNETIRIICGWMRRAWPENPSVNEHFENVVASIRNGETTVVSQIAERLKIETAEQATGLSLQPDTQPELKATDPEAADFQDEKGKWVHRQWLEENSYSPQRVSEKCKSRYISRETAKREKGHKTITVYHYGDVVKVGMKASS